MDWSGQIVNRNTGIITCFLWILAVGFSGCISLTDEDPTIHYTQKVDERISERESFQIYTDPYPGKSIHLFITKNQVYRYTGPDKNKKGDLRTINSGSVHFEINQGRIQKESVPIVGQYSQTSLLNRASLEAPLAFYSWENGADAYLFYKGQNDWKRIRRSYEQGVYLERLYYIDKNLKLHSPDVTWREGKDRRGLEPTDTLSKDTITITFRDAGHEPIGSLVYQTENFGIDFRDYVYTSSAQFLITYHSYPSHQLYLLHQVYSDTIISDTLDVTIWDLELNGTVSVSKHFGFVRSAGEVRLFEHAGDSTQVVTIDRTFSERYQSIILQSPTTSTEKKEEFLTEPESDIPSTPSVTYPQSTGTRFIPPPNFKEWGSDGCIHTGWNQFYDLKSKRFDNRAPILKSNMPIFTYQNSCNSGGPDTVYLPESLSGMNEVGWADIGLDADDEPFFICIFRWGEMRTFISESEDPYYGSDTQWTVLGRALYLIQKTDGQWEFTLIDKDQSDMAADIL